MGALSDCDCKEQERGRGGTVTQGGGGEGARGSEMEQSNYRESGGRKALEVGSSRELVRGKK